MRPGRDQHLHIGAIVFPQVDQADLTGPFEVLSRLPDSTFYVLGRELAPVSDMYGLILTPTATFAEAPILDLLLVPGGWGQEALMEDEDVLGFIRASTARGAYTFSVCTGALLCGAAGILRGIRSTTHWSAFHLLKYFGAIPVDARVVIDGRFISAAGITAGLDGALRAASLLRGESVAQQIQLSIEYAPEPPFDSGTPMSAPRDVLEAVRASCRQIGESRLFIAQQFATRHGIKSN